MDQFIQLGLGGVALGLLGYFLRETLKQNKHKDATILTLVDEFRDTINHQRTKDREALEKLTTHIASQTEVFKQLIKPKRR